MSDLLNGWDEDGEPVKIKLTDRIRPGSEAAPWVFREVKELEQRIAELEKHVVACSDTCSFQAKQIERLRAALQEKHCEHHWHREPSTTATACPVCNQSWKY